MAKVNSLKVDKPKHGRRFAVSDIHGCSNTFEQLIKQIALTKEDQLFIIGDAVNRGPSSSAVLDQIIKLQENNYQIYYLRGNHEQMILDAIGKKPKKRKKLLKKQNSDDLLDDRIIIDEYKNVLKKSYHFIETDDYFIVHAGFDFSSENPFEETHAMLYQNKFKATNEQLKGKQVLLGHNPKILSKILKKIKKGKRKLYIDNGCVNHKEEGQGNLLCLNMDTLAVSLQPNCDQ